MPGEISLCNSAVSKLPGLSMTLQAPRRISSGLPVLDDNCARGRMATSAKPCLPGQLGDGPGQPVRESGVEYAGGWVLIPNRLLSPLFASRLSVSPQALKSQTHLTVDSLETEDVLPDCRFYLGVAVQRP